MAKVQKTNEILSHQVRDLTIEVEKLKEENAQLKQQQQQQEQQQQKQQEAGRKKKREAYSMPPADMPPIIEPLSRESSAEVTAVWAVVEDIPSSHFLPSPSLPLPSLHSPLLPPLTRT